jgi:hypothetical protein
MKVEGKNIVNGRVLGQGSVDEEFHKEYESDTTNVVMVVPDISTRM